MSNVSGKMNTQTHQAMLAWVSSLTDEPVDGLTKDYGHTFIKILQFLDSSATLDEFPSTKDRVKAAQLFLQNHYSVSFADDKPINFSLLLEDRPPSADVDLEGAKVILLLLCAGIQERNSDIQTTALRVDESLHIHVKQMIEAVLKPDDPTTSLPQHFADVLLQPTPSLIHQHSSTPKGKTGHRRDTLRSWSVDLQDSPLRGMTVGGLNLSSLALNESLTAVGSPLRAGSLSNSNAAVTPLEELMNSPQLARKIMRREKEQRYKLERQLKEKDEEVKRAQHKLSLQVDLQEDLEMDLKEAHSQLEKKESKIQALEAQMSRMRALQDSLDEFGALRDSNLELERDVESLRGKAHSMETLKQYNHTLKEENHRLYEDIATLQEQVSKMEKLQSEATRAQLESHKLNVRVAEMQAALDTAHEVRDTMNMEKATLMADLDVLREVVSQQRRQLTDRRASVDEPGTCEMCIGVQTDLVMDESATSGECMGVVTDKLLEEVNQQLKTMKDTWTPPDVMASLQADYARSMQQVEDLQSQLDSLTSQHEELQTALSAQVSDLETRLHASTEQCKDTATQLQQSSEKCLDLQTQLGDLEIHSNDLACRLSTTEKDLESVKGSLAEKSELCQKLVSELDTEKRDLEKEGAARREAERELGECRESLEQTVSRNKELTEALCNKGKEADALSGQVIMTVSWIVFLLVVVFSMVLFGFDIITIRLENLKNLLGLQNFRDIFN